MFKILYSLISIIYKQLHVHIILNLKHIKQNMFILKQKSCFKITFFIFLWPNLIKGRTHNDNRTVNQTKKHSRVRGIK